MRASAGTDRAVREGSQLKRAAILEAARELFARLGVDGVSMDAVAAKAGVSKVTVYDYFGDKKRLFAAILSAASESLDTSARKVLDQHISDTAGITTVAELEAALVAVAVDLGTTVVASAEYATAFALVAQQRMQTGSAEDDVATEGLEDALAERMAHFAGIGLLDTEHPRVAADHFAALTVLLAYNHQPVPAKATPERIRGIMIDGARAFIRAYATRPDSPKRV
ncbi:TetR/AcrR family transcriptional regulator [Clavibacter sp. Sh2088]|uniref:TetR/AcrR family transcriptional regulator n=1 Tax=Clavibacter sp. Sh2088 TaxID=3397676 RepID=UPI0039DF98E6